MNNESASDRDAHRSQDSPGRSSSIRNVLVTGGAGFIGSNFLCTMVDRYKAIRFVCFDALRSCSSVKNLNSIGNRKNFVFVRGDICDSSHLLNTMIDYKIDSVIHFAAESSVDKSINMPNVFSYSNIAGSMIIAECCHQAGVPILIYASTDEVYGENDFKCANAFTEASMLMPSNPYAITKAVSDIILRTWCNVPLIVVRSCNVYGPRQFPEKLVPKLICQRMSGLKYTIHGDGMNWRCYMHVDDCINAFESILFHGKIGEIYNVGTQEELSNLDVASHVANLFGDHFSQDSVEFVIDRQYNDKRYWMSSCPIRELGWSSSISFPVGIKQTAEWYEANLAGHWRLPVSKIIAAHPSWDSESRFDKYIFN